MNQTNATARFRNAHTLVLLFTFFLCANYNLLFSQSKAKATIDGQMAEVRASTSSRIYSQFIEHLGRSIKGGIYDVVKIKEVENIPIKDKLIIPPASIVIYQCQIE